MRDAWETTWWDVVTGPHRLQSKVVGALEQGTSVVLQDNHLLPWLDTLRNNICHRLGRASLREIEWARAVDKSEIAFEYLLPAGSPHWGACPAKFKSQLQYLKAQELFAWKILWFHVDESADPAPLFRFMADYKSGGLDRHGTIVAVVPSGRELPLESGSLLVLRDKAYVTPNDVRIYAALVRGGENEDAALHEYAASACASLAGDHLELIPVLLERIDFRKDDPVAAALVACESQGITDVDERTLSRRLWKAQLETGYSLIEMERVRLVEQLHDEIEDALDTEYWDAQTNGAGYVEQWGDVVEDASDVELGTLRRMACLGRQGGSEDRLLRIRDPQVRDEISFLADCRNKMAHHKLCAPQEMARLLELAGSHAW